MAISIKFIKTHRSLLLALTLIAFFSVSAGLRAQENDLRVVLTVLRADENVPRGDALAEALSDKIELMLKLSGDLEVIRADFIVPTFSLAKSEMYYREVRGDRAVYGALRLTDDGTLEFSVEIWEKDSPKSRVRASDSANELALQVASRILGQKVEVGSIRIDGAESLANYSVYVDGNPVGRGIVELLVPVGDHEVIVAVPGQLGDQPVEIFDVNIRADRLEKLLVAREVKKESQTPTEATPATETPGAIGARQGAIVKTGSLAIESSPTGADVFLDGRQLGTTPLSLFGVPVGRYELSVQKPLFSESISVVEVAEGRRERVDLDLNLDLESPEVNALLVPTWAPSVVSLMWSLAEGIFLTAQLLLDETLSLRFLTTGSYDIDVLLLDAVLLLGAVSDTTPPAI